MAYYKPMEIAQIITRCILTLTIIPPSFSSLRFLGSENRLPVVRGGSVYLGHKTGSWCPGVLGSKFKLPSTGLTVY